LSVYARVAIQNHLLAALPDRDFARLRGSLKQVSLGLGEVIYESGEQIEHIYFPIDSVISLLYTTEEGATAEMGLAGNDGFVGLALLLGGNTTPNRAVAQIAGECWRIRAGIVRDEFTRGGALQALVMHYIHAFITQVSQTAVCNRLHSVEKRLCRWLLLCHDRTFSNDLWMTQEFIANMLGGRRESVTVAAGRLQDLGWIRYARGRITILDRNGLEGAVCECYRTVKNEADRLVSLRERSIKAALKN